MQESLSSIASSSLEPICLLVFRSFSPHALVMTPAAGMVWLCYRCYVLRPYNLRFILLTYLFKTLSMFPHARLHTIFHIIKYLLAHAQRLLVLKQLKAIGDGVTMRFLEFGTLKRLCEKVEPAMRIINEMELEEGNELSLSNVKEALAAYAEKTFRDGRWTSRSKLMQPHLPLLLYLLSVKRLKLLLPKLLLLLHPLPLLLLSQHQWAIAHLGCLSDTVDITLRELVCGITPQFIWEHSNSTATLRTVSVSLRKSAGTLLERVFVSIRLLGHATRSILTYLYVELRQASS